MNRSVKIPRVNKDNRAKTPTSQTGKLTGDNKNPPAVVIPCQIDCNTFGKNKRKVPKTPVITNKVIPAKTSTV